MQTQSQGVCAISAEISCIQPNNEGSLCCLCLHKHTDDKAGEYVLQHPSKCNFFFATVIILVLLGSADIPHLELKFSS